MSVEIHPTAQIEKGVQLGEGVRIGPFTYIQSGAEIGDNCQIGSSVWISEFVRMGDNNKIAHAAALGGDPQDLKFEGEKTVLRIGDNNDIREYVTMNRGTNASGQSVVGSNNMLMAYCHVAHDCVVGG